MIMYLKFTKDMKYSINFLRDFDIFNNILNAIVELNRKTVHYDRGYNAKGSEFIQDTYRGYDSKIQKLTHLILN